MFMAIILFLGQIISLFLITRMFPDPIIPALALTLEPFIATLFLDLTDIQRIPGRWTFVGYTMMVPGMALILVGQCLFQRMASRQQEQEQRSVTLMRELK
jgi:short subunit fatty acids transporter